MSKLRNKKRPPKRVLSLPDLEQAKTTVLNSLTSKSGQRTYERAITDFVEWYRSEPRLAFIRSCELTYGAVVEFQKKAGIVPPSGFFGPITRAYVNQKL